MQGINWNKFIEVKLKFWRYFYKMWVEDRPNKLMKIVFYEDLRTNLLKTVREIIAFIEIPFIQARLDCVVRDNNQVFKRRMLNTDYSSYFSSSQQIMIAREVDKLNNTLVSHGHNQLPGTFQSFNSMNYCKILD